MSKEKPCHRSLEELCDILELTLGKEKGSEKCKELLAEIKKCPTCCAELDTMTKTIRVFQHIPKKEVPQDVQWRLKTTLKLEMPVIEKEPGTQDAQKS